MSFELYFIGVVVLLFLVTCVTRGLPFIFGEWISRQRVFMALGQQLPAAIILMLLIYYMMTIAKPSHWHNLIWQVIALLVTLGIQWRYRKAIVSLIIGTVLYLLLQRIY